MIQTRSLDTGGVAFDSWQQCTTPLTAECTSGKFRAYGTFDSTGVDAEAGTAVFARGFNSPISYGVKARGGTALHAQSSFSNGYGLYVYNDYNGAGATTGNAIFASSLKTTAIYAQSTAINGVTGKSFSSGAGGLYGENFANGFGAVGRANGSGTGLMGDIQGGTGWAGFFWGKVHVNGVLSKSSGTFRIDHPQDPTNKYLNHSFVESPDMKNIYDGVAVLDASGQATVTLPGYFEALNSDFRYQLTPMGGPASLYVKQEISHSQFSIAGGTSGMRVSWQVTGSRIDAFARANPIVVEEAKPPSARGKYLNPEVFGLPRSASEGPVLSDKATATEQAGAIPTEQSAEK